MRRVVITGGEGDLGRALASAFRKAGGDVLGPGRDVLDVTSADSVRSFFARLSGLDVLVCCAAATADRAAARMMPADWDAAVEPTLGGAFLCVREALPLLERSGRGHIVLIGSHSGVRGAAGQANYAAAKAGLEGFGKALALEAGSLGIRVNTVLPGFMETKMTRHLDRRRINEIRAAHALGRFSVPDEAAAFVAFLDARLPAVSGQTFSLDSRILP